MFLLHIQKNKIERSKMLKLIYITNTVKKVQSKILFLKKLKSYKKLKNLRLLLSKNYLFKSKNLIKYIIGISVSSSMIIIYVSNINGNIKFFCTAGSLGIKKKKKNKLAVLIKLIKVMMFKVKFISKQDTIALHIINCNEYLSKFITSFLAKLYNIEMIKMVNNQPHNGCRPKKVKRKKRRKLSFSRRND